MARLVIQKRKNRQTNLKDTKKPIEDCKDMDVEDGNVVFA